MTDLTGFQITDLVTDWVADYYNKILGGILRSEFYNTETITATKELADIDTPYQVITASGADRTVELPPEATSNHPFLIYNGGASNNVVVKDDAGAITYATLAANEYGYFVQVQGKGWVKVGPPSSAASATFWTAASGTPTRASNTTFTVTGDYTTLFKKGMIIKWTETGTTRWGMVSIPSTYGAPNTTITIIGNTMASIDASSLKYAMIGAEAFAWKFAVAGTIGATGTDVANAKYAEEPMIVLGADLQVGTAGTTNSTTIDINKGGTTMFTTKPTLATTVASSPTPFTADTATTLALGDKVTMDIDAIQTTAAIDLYATLYVFPSRYEFLT